VTSSVARVSFHTADARDVVTTGAIGRTAPRPTPGASIDIRYDPGDPSTIRIGSADSSSGGFVVLVGAAAVMFLAGTVFAVSF
jgi:hypothetical protein